MRKTSLTIVCAVVVIICMTTIIFIDVVEREWVTIFPPIVCIVMAVSTIISQLVIRELSGNL